MLWPLLPTAVAETDRLFLPSSASVNGWVELKHAIYARNGSSSTVVLDAVAFDSSDYESQIVISNATNVTIAGHGTVLDAFQKGRLFEVAAGGSLSLDSVTLQNGFPKSAQEGCHYSCPSGGAIYNAGTLILDSSTIKDCRFSLRWTPYGKVREGQ